MSTNFDRDFSKGFVSAFPQSFANAADGWQKMQELRRNIENDNFQKDNYLQKRRQESDKERRAAAARKTVVSLYKDRLRSSLADLDPEDQARYAKVLDETDDNVTPEVLNEHLTNIEKGISDAATRRKAKLEVEGLNNRKAGILKAAESQVARGRSAGDYDFILTLVEDGSPEAIKQAQAALKWDENEGKNKNKVTLAEEKAALIEEIWALAGDEDFNAGLERLKKVDKQKFARADAIGVKKAKVEENPNEKFVLDALSAFDRRDKAYQNMSLREYIPLWLENRRGLISEDAAKYVMGKLYPERTSLWQPPQGNESPTTPTATPQPVPTPTPTMQPPVAPMQASVQEPIAPAPVQPNQQISPEDEAQAKAELQALMDELTKMEAMFKK